MSRIIYGRTDDSDLSSFLKQFVQIDGGSVIGQEVECAVCLDVLRGAEECAPCGQGETGTDRNTAHAEIG